MTAARGKSSPSGISGVRRRRRTGRAEVMPRSSISSSSWRSSERTKSRVAMSRKRDSQGGDLAGEELRVGEVALVAGAVLLQRDAVAVGLAVLREQDERGGVGRLQRQDQREQGEVRLARVELQPPGWRRCSTPARSRRTRSCRTRNCAVPIHRAKPSLSAPKVSCENDGVGTNRRRNSCGWSRRGTSDDRRRGLGRSGRSATGHLGRARRRIGYAAWSSWRSSRQSSGRMWSRTSSTVTAPRNRPSRSTTGTATRL